MNKSDEEIRNELSVIESFHIEKAIEHLRNYGHGIQEYLAQCVAAICDVSIDDMLSKTDVIFLAHARWLYWYAYRYMTNESYEKIARSTPRNGHKYKLRAIQSGVSKMSMMIANEPMWTKRWTIIKHIIKLRECNSDAQEDNTIIIQVPKDLKGKINITIKDK